MGHTLVNELPILHEVVSGLKGPQGAKAGQRTPWMPPIYAHLSMIYSFLAQGVWWLVMVK